MFDRLGLFAYRRRRLVLAVVGVWFACALALLVRGGRLSTGLIHGLEAERAGALADAITGHASDTTFVAIFRSPMARPGEKAFDDAVERALAPLRQDARVGAITTAADLGPLGDAMTNRDARAAFAVVSVRGEFGDAAHEYPALRAKLRSDTLTVTCTGTLSFTDDLDRVLEEDLIHAELISLPICILLLLAVFRSVVAALVPVGVGALSVASGIAAVMVLSHYIEIAQYTLNMCSLIGLGVAIDYSLFIVSRYREELAAGADYEKALRKATGTAGRVVVFSGFAVTTGLAGLLLFPRSYLLSMGLGGAIVVGFAVVFALTFLPALLAVLGPAIDRGRLPWTRTRPQGTLFRVLAEWAMRRPLLVLVPALACLVYAGLPFFRLQIAAPDVRVLPLDTEARAGYELLRKAFPEQAENHITAVVDFPSSPALTPARIEALYDFVKRVQAMPSVGKVRGLIDPSEPVPKEALASVLLAPSPETAPAVELVKRLTVGAHAVSFDVTTPALPDSVRAQELVRALRKDRRVGDGTLVVGGDTANNVDSAEFLSVRAPHLIALVVAITCLVLFVSLGSVLLPLKAVLMNFLSITASFGALVWVFQEGHLFVSEPRPLDPSLPVLLFCALFGLSMDYEVLMLMRMKEAYEQTGDNRRAVVDGLEKSAGLITSAAAIMVSVFGAFAFSRIVVIQAVGFGMALAVAIDATIVRALIVPTTMRLLGNLNWWAPRSVVTFLKSLGLDTTH
ncbi:MAG TPA: MMPL family transporter [Polyangiaceae bacterium]|nr:MMPL family transporter [Polyangiaceae bacterium]